MTLYRFSDALQELDSSLGMQVHRSYWVNKSAIQSVRKRGRQMSLEMLDGSSVPVSGPYQALVRQAAADLDLPVKPGGA
jgi:DNA-binding LytR/AlgR family response regulator